MLILYAKDSSENLGRGELVDDFQWKRPEHLQGLVAKTPPESLSAKQMMDDIQGQKYKDGALYHTWRKGGVSPLTNPAKRPKIDQSGIGAAGLVLFFDPQNFGKFSKKT